MEPEDGQGETKNCVAHRAMLNSVATILMLLCVVAILRSTSIQKPLALPAVLQCHYQALMSIRSFCCPK
jgi:hypothetical protein